MAARTVSLVIGARLGPYEIVSPIGKGGMGEVYRARDTRLGRDVAIKVLSAGTEQNHERLARFESEARAVAALSHPNIRALHDIGNDSGIAYAVMELLEGDTLAIGSCAAGACRRPRPSSSRSRSRTGWPPRTHEGLSIAT